MNYILNARSITKVYEKDIVVNEINLQLCEGEIYGLLGENGAGKTTFMKILTSLTKPTSGNVELFGESLESNNNLLKEVGTLIETPVFYDSLSALENLEIHCKYKGINLDVVSKYLKMLGIYDVREKKVKEFSLGMKQRLGIARAIIDNPKLLVLDEPTNGLDPKGIKEMRELLLYLSKERKTTILISSHILSEIENTADRIGFMDKGVLIKEIDIHEFKNKLNSYFEITLENVDSNYSVFSDNFIVLEKREKSILIKAQNWTVLGISMILLEQGVEIKDIRSGHVSLEEYFVQIIDGS